MNLKEAEEKTILLERRIKLISSIVSFVPAETISSSLEECNEILTEYQRLKLLISDTVQTCKVGNDLLFSDALIYSKVLEIKISLLEQVLTRTDLSNKEKESVASLLKGCIEHSSNLAGKINEVLYSTVLLE